MTKAERAVQHYITVEYDFDVHTETEMIHFRATTQNANKLAVLLETKPSVKEISTGHPEFLGWTPVEIEQNLTD